MPKQTIADRVKDRLLNAFKTRDAKALDEVIGDFEAIVEGGGNESINHVNANVVGGGVKQDPTEGERLRVIEDWMKAQDAKRMADEAKEEEEKKKKETEDKKSKDEAEEEEKKRKAAAEDEYEKQEGEKEEEHEKRTGDSLKLIQQRAEILSPGFKVPTLDCKCKDKRIRDQVTDIKRNVLAAAYKTADGKKAIEPFLAGKTVEALSHVTVDAAFIGASTLMAALNNGRAKPRTTSNDNQTVDAFSKGGIDKINQDFWKKKGA